MNTSDILGALLAKREALESALERIDVWLLLFGILVVVGVGGESVFGIRAWLDNRRLREVNKSVERQQQIEGDRINNERQIEIARLNEQAGSAAKQAADANERTAKAELDLARLRQPRMLHDKVALIAHIKPFSGTKYNFESVFQDSESVDLLIQIEGILSSSGWIRQKGLGKFPALAIWGQTDAVSVGIYSGIHIVVEDTGLERGPLWTAAEALGAALRSSLGPDSNIAAGVVVAAQASPTSIQIIHINVGKKP